MCTKTERAGVKVGFYLRNMEVAEVDLRQPEKGNPGVGGTQFNFVTLPYYLQKHNSDTVEPIIYANAPNRLPKETTAREAKNAVDAARKAERDGCEMIVFRPTERTRQMGLLDLLSNLDLKAVAWGHNVPLPLSHMNELARTDSVSRFVVVGRERFDQIRDHPLFKKSRCIYNGFDPSPYIPNEVICEEVPTVAYVGSLIPTKGFHRLAEAWPSIKQKVSQAKLVVIGSGRLYDRNAELGRWGIASEQYEKKFRPYLSNHEGEVHSSVEFKGTLGTEKIPLLQKAHVGVVNPTGSTENCPGSAIEFQAAGTPVVSIAEWGLIDTVQDERSGILIRDKEELADAVARLLVNDGDRIAFGRTGIQFVQKKFSHDKICDEWSRLFERVRKDLPTISEPVKQNLFYRDKWLRELMRRAKQFMPRLESVPPLFELDGKRDLAKHLLSALLK